VLRLPPLTGLTDRSAEIHVLTSGQDWLNLIWTLRSFYTVSTKRLVLCIHADHTVTRDAAAELMRQFPEARLIVATEADDSVIPSLADYALCRRFRESNTLARKIFDFRHYLSTDRMALFDSDLIFFATPREFLDHLDSGRRTNIFNGDIANAYALEADALTALGVPVMAAVNSGFGLVHRDSLRLEWFEEFLSLPGMIEGHFWRIEQTLFALASTRFGGELLPDKYRVYLDRPIGCRPVRHYVGAIRHLMYAQGMRRVQRAVLS
jgi:hypothetical protein